MRGKKKQTKNLNKNKKTNKKTLKKPPLKKKPKYFSSVKAKYSAPQILFSYIILEYLAKISPLLQKAAVARRCSFPQYRNILLGHSPTARVLSSIRCFKKHRGRIVYRMPSLSNHFLFFSSSKKLKRYKIRDILKHAVAEHMTFSPKEKNISYNIVF